jgi:uncharacterized membrane protein
MSFWKKSVFFPMLLVLLILPSCFFLFQNSIYFNMHDDLQMIRQLEMDKCLSDGQFPCRWVPDMGYGYGYPLFNFYPPLPYLVGHLFRLGGFSYVNAVKLTFALQFFVLSFGAYSLGRFLFKSKLAGFLVALLLNYAPYHAVNIYVRGALNESWALSFFPWIILFGLKLTRRLSLITFLGLSLSIAGLLLSHLPMSLVFIPAAGLLFLLSLNPLRQPASYLLKISLILASSLFFGLILASFFVLPALLETSFVNMQPMFSDYYHFSVHFTSLKQLFVSNYWGDGPSVWGQNDQMSFSVGYLQWLIPLVSIIFLAYSYIKTKKLKPGDFYLLVSVFFGLFYVFLTHERSALIWVILTPLQKVQFPWRLLNPAIFFLSLSV